MIKQIIKKACTGCSRSVQSTRYNVRFAIAAVLFTLYIVQSTSYIGFAGNEQRAGQAGATELLINPWARSSGWGGANTSGVRGLEAINLNVAGTAFTKKTELIFCHTNWLAGTGISMNAFGLSQKVGESGVFSLSFMNINVGDIEITTVELPEGGIGTYRPTLTNISLAYAKEFSNSIYGGLVVKIINEKTADISASGVAFDAGIQYLTGLGKNKLGKKIHDNLHFGISMRNWGPTMRFRGDGLSFRGSVPPNDIIMTVEQRSAEFEIPVLMTIGAMYDLYVAQKVDTVADKIKSDHRISIAGNFTSNSFTNDQLHAGIEYSFKEIIMIRGGYVYEKGIGSYDTRATAFTGPTVGVSVQIPLNKEKGSTFSIDYSYRDTNPFNGVHSIGAKITL
ncbi:MAG: PorV/PorQ family protein [Bacteroidetes bacterium]|nr:PorV/PorQ family protein [Bacteroidota bacterium]